MSNVNATSTSGVSALGMGGISNGATFDGDTLLAYCSVQLNGLQGEIKARMTAQQAVRDSKSALTTLQNTLTDAMSKGGVNNADAALKTKILEQYEAVLAKLPPGDQWNQVNQSYQTFRSTACYRNGAPMGEGKTVGFDVMQTAETNKDGANANDVTAAEVKGLIDGLSNVSEDLGKNAELEMIDLQQLVSQRQMAIQMTTNMMNKCSQGPETIAANIGK